MHSRLHLLRYHHLQVSVKCELAVWRWRLWRLRHLLPGFLKGRCDAMRCTSKSPSDHHSIIQSVPVPVCLPPIEDAASYCWPVCRRRSALEAAIIFDGGLLVHRRDGPSPPSPPKRRQHRAAQEAAVASPTLNSAE